MLQQPDLTPRPADPPPRDPAWRAFLESLPFGVLVHDAAGCVAYANPAVETLLGTPRAEMLGRGPVEARFPLRHPGGEPIADHEHPAHAALLSGAAVTGVLFRVDAPGEDEPRWLELDALPLPSAEGAPAQVCTLVRDVTEARRTREALRRTQDRFRVALNTPAVVLALCDRELRYTWIHNPHADFDARAVLGRRDDEVAPPDVAGPWVALKSRILATGQAAREVIGAALSDGTHHYDVIAHPVLGEDGSVVGVSTASVDVTERVEAERRALEESERRRVALEAAEAASLAKSQFLAVMSHELRTPLNAIVGYQDLLCMELKGPVGGGQREFLDRIKQNAVHLLGIIDEILTVARVEAGSEELLLERAEIGGVVRRAAALLKPRADEKGLVFRIDLPVEPVEATTDVQKVRQIVLNLLSNALRFTERGEVMLRVWRDGGQGVHVAVHDTGPGIDGASLERIFEPFTQLDQSNTRQAGGTGLGLAIARRYAHILGGELRVESTPGQGSTFTLALPREHPDAGPAES